MSALASLLKINNVTCPHVDKGTITITRDDVFNTYTAENGRSTIEEVLTGKIIADVSYKGLMAADVKSVVDAITLVSTVVLYDPGENSTVTITAKISGIKTQKVVYEQGISAWSLAFKIEEL